MKKFLLAIFVIGCYVVYSLHGRNNGTVLVTPPTVASGSGTSPTPTSTPGSTGSSPAPTPTSSASGVAYKDGQYTGSQADAYYGYVQVQAIISGGKLTAVNFLQYPNTHETSIEINSQAMPYLQQEAIAAQSANVDVVSGATLTSDAFIQSLTSALQSAKS